MSLIIGLSLFFGGWAICGIMTYYLQQLNSTWHEAEASFMWCANIAFGPIALWSSAREVLENWWNGRLFCKIDGCRAYRKTYDGYCTKHANEAFQERLGGS